MLDLRDRTGVGVAVVGEVSLGQPCCRRISMQPLLPVFLANIMAVWPRSSFTFTSIPYCGGEYRVKTDLCLDNVRLYRLYI